MNLELFMASTEATNKELNALLERIAEALEVRNGLALIETGRVHNDLRGQAFMNDTAQLALDRLKVLAERAALKRSINAGSA